jgi:hypothetical protein
MTDIEFVTPNLGDVIAYRGVYVLGTTRLNPDTGRMKLVASHYASCLVFGKSPLWAVWTAGGKFLRFYSFRSDIARAYPRLIWRRRMASWSLMAVDDLKPAARKASLADRFNAKLPKVEEAA